MSNHPSGLSDAQIENRLCTLALMAASLEAADRTREHPSQSQKGASEYADRAQQLMDAVESRQLPVGRTSAGWHATHVVEPEKKSDMWRCVVCGKQTPDGPGWGELAKPCAGLTVPEHEDAPEPLLTHGDVRAILAARGAYPLGSASHRELIAIASRLASTLPPHPLVQSELQNARAQYARHQ